MGGKVLAGIAGACLGVLGGLVLVLATSPTIQVEIESAQEHARIEVPVRLAPVVLRFVPDTILDEARMELQPYYPVLTELLYELPQMGDCTLFAVQDGEESVEVRKLNDSLIVEIVDHDERVRIQVPIRHLIPVLRILDPALVKTAERT
ncbi:MAG: hypothetical protein Kow00109_28360 [Acidobacteriota bacterium]